MKVLTPGCGLLVILSYIVMLALTSMPSRVYGDLVREGVEVPPRVREYYGTGIRKVERVARVSCGVSLFLFVYGGVRLLKDRERRLAAGKAARLGETGDGL